MTEQDKQLLLKDLCARLPYGVRARFCDGVKEETDDVWDIDMFSGAINADYIIDDVKPYLRPMSSMTEEEKEDIKPLFTRVWTDGNKKLLVVRQNKMAEYLDYLYSHHFDFCGLINKSLALVAPEYMYPPEEKLK